MRRQSQGAITEAVLSDMSFSVPRNVPTFSAPQRQLENQLWGSSGTVHGRATSGQSVGGKINGFFSENELPMYKDKPYNYAGSARRLPIWRRKRVLLLLAAVALTGLYLFGASSPPGAPASIPVGKSGWVWRKPGGSAETQWQARRDQVRDAFILSWNAYEGHAWGVYHSSIPSLPRIHTLRRSR